MADLEHGRIATWLASFDKKAKKGESYDLVARIAAETEQRVPKDIKLALALAAGMVGAYGGAYLGRYVPEQLLLGLFAALMLATSIAMLRGRQEAAGPVPPPSVPRLLLLGLVFGAITGVLGAGGGFLIVPALNLLAGLTMTEAVGTSLLVITMNSLAGYAGASGHVSIDGALAAEVALAAVLGSQLGALFAKQVPAAMLRRGFAVFVLVLGVIQLANSVGASVH